MPVVPSKSKNRKGSILAPRDCTDIHVNQAPGQFVRIFVNGELVAEVSCQKASVKTDWERVLGRARALNMVPKILKSFAERLDKIHNREDHNHPKPTEKVISYLTGFADGLLGINVEHPVNKDFPRLNLRMYRDHSPCFCEGYEAGECVRNICKSQE